jgi:hypothetical protein
MTANSLKKSFVECRRVCCGSNAKVLKEDVHSIRSDQQLWEKSQIIIIEHCIQVREKAMNQSVLTKCKHRGFLDKHAEFHTLHESMSYYCK